MYSTLRRWSLGVLTKMDEFVGLKPCQCCARGVFSIHRWSLIFFDNSFRMRREELNQRLETAVKERPALWHVLDLQVVTRAVIAAFIAAVVVWLLIGPAAAAVVLLLVYFGGWALLARLSYEKRRETQPVDTRPAGAS